MPENSPSPKPKDMEVTVFSCLVRVDDDDEDEVEAVRSAAFCSLTAAALPGTKGTPWKAAAVPIVASRALEARTFFLLEQVICWAVVHVARDAIAMRVNAEGSEDESNYYSFDTHACLRKRSCSASPVLCCTARLGTATRGTTRLRVHILLGSREKSNQLSTLF